MMRNRRLSRTTLVVLLLIPTLVLGWAPSISADGQAVHSVDDVAFTMYLAPALPFPADSEGEDSVTVENDFYVAETPVTYELWHAVIQWAQDHGYTFSNLGREGSSGAIGEPPTDARHHPVTEVSWYDAVVWTNALSEIKGLTPAYTYNGEVIRDTEATDHTNIVLENTDGLRLPTSEEWELAARFQGDDSSHGAMEHPEGSGVYWTPGDYASGAAGSHEDEDAVSEAAWYRDNSDVDGRGRGTQPVGQKPPGGNFLGLYDMSGNVWEWTSSAMGSERLFRGGSWLVGAAFQTVGSVSGWTPETANNTYGLRIARTAP